MKIKVEVDCTPEEVRAFFGLPDVRPLQQAAMTRLEQRMAEAANALSPEALIKTWLPFVPQSPEQLRDMVRSLFRSPPPQRPQAGSETPTAPEGEAPGAQITQ